MQNALKLHLFISKEFFALGKTLDFFFIYLIEEHLLVGRLFFYSNCTLNCAQATVSPLAAVSLVVTWGFRNFFFGAVSRICVECPPGKEMKKK